MELLFHACKIGDVAEVKRLLAEGADVNAKNEYYVNTPLLIASMDGHEEVVKVLLANGANVNTRNKYGQTPLHEAPTKEVAVTLLVNGADVNTKNDYGWRVNIPVRYGS